MRTRYVVTKASDDETFLVGDHIYFELDGTISCLEAQGWIEETDAIEALKGMEYEVDKVWIENKKKRLQVELDKLNKEI